VKHFPKKRAAFGILCAGLTAAALSGCGGQDEWQDSDALMLTVSTSNWTTQDRLSCEAYGDGKVLWKKTDIDGNNYELEYEIPEDELKELKELTAKPMSEYKEAASAAGVLDGTYYDIVNYGPDGAEKGEFTGLILYNDDLEEIVGIVMPDDGVFYSDDWTQVS